MKTGLIRLAAVLIAGYSSAAMTYSQETCKTVKIENLVWMLDNLDVSCFRNGDSIPEARTAGEWASAGQERKPAWCYYDNDSHNGGRYGKLYNWYAVSDPRGLAPGGWHVSTDAEWRRVTDFLGGEDAAGTMMKSSSGWEQDGNGTNSSGFTGFPGGCRPQQNMILILPGTGLLMSVHIMYTVPIIINKTGYRFAV
jgi:uncharacterized protein (TIGR02145 family)